LPCASPPPVAPDVPDSFQPGQIGLYSISKVFWNRTLTSACSRLFHYGDGAGRAQGGGVVDGLAQLSRRVVVEHDDEAVLVALVEHLRRGQHTLSRADAPVVVHHHSHDVLQVTGSSSTP